MTFKVLGIDPGTRVTGFGVVQTNGSQLRCVDFGSIKPPPKLPIEQRYLAIFEGIQDIINDFAPDAVAVESQYVHKNPQSAIKLGMAKSAVFIAAAHKGLPIVEYTPTKVKKAVVGHGRASKGQVQAMIKILLKLRTIPEPEDAADALAIAICYIQNNRL